MVSTIRPLGRPEDGVVIYKLTTFVLMPKFVFSGMTPKSFKTFLISSFATHMDALKKIALEEVKGHIDNAYIEDVYGAYSVMSMNAIYYRFTHLSENNDYTSMPANLRMQYLSKHKIDKSDFEMLCLAVAIIIGCGKCINAHENILRENNISKLHIQTVARVASIVNSIANVIRVLN